MKLSKKANGTWGQNDRLLYACCTAECCFIVMWIGYSSFADLIVYVHQQILNFTLFE